MDFNIPVANITLNGIRFAIWMNVDEFESKNQTTIANAFRETSEREPGDVPLRVKWYKLTRGVYWPTKLNTIRRRFTYFN